jgi:hypothetical protein
MPVENDLVRRSVSVNRGASGGFHQVSYSIETVGLEGPKQAHRLFEAHFFIFPFGEAKNLRSEAARNAG